MQLDHSDSMGRHVSPNTDSFLDVPASSRIKSILMERLREMRRSRGLTQTQAASWFGVSQPRISHLACDHTDRFTVDTLINMLAHAGIRLALTFEAHPNEEDRRTSMISDRQMTK